MAYSQMYVYIVGVNIRDVKSEKYSVVVCSALYGVLIFVFCMRIL